MDSVHTGGCACMALRYATHGQPVAQTLCQCRDCQRRSGTGHSAWLVFAEPPDEVVTGPASRWSVLGESGMQKLHAFCPTCGTPVYLAFPDMPGIIAVTAASLDDPARFAPTQVTWTEMAQPWDRIDPGLIAFMRMPPR
jgi:hypothetical protein